METRGPRPVLPGPAYPTRTFRNGGSDQISERSRQAKPETRRRRRSPEAAHGRGREAARLVHRRPHRRRGEEAARAIRPQRNRGGEDQRAAQIPQLFLGSDSLDDRSRGRAIGRRAPLARLLHHSLSALLQRDHRILGRAPGGQRHRSVEGAASHQGARETQRQMDHAGRQRPRPRRCDSSASGRHRSRRRALARGRRNLG